MPFVDAEQIVVRQTGDADWVLEQPLTYVGRHQSFTVPAGSGTDFASVPRALVWLIPRYGRYTKAAILHDYLWRQNVVSKGDADGIFRRALRELGTPIVRRWLMWAAVRLASIFQHRGLPGTRPRELAALVMTAILGAGFVVIPFLVVSVWIMLFFAVEGVTYVVAWVWRHLRRRPTDRALNAPRIGWRMS